MTGKQVLGLATLAAIGTVGTAASFGAYGWSRSKRHSLTRSSLTAGGVALVATLVVGLAAPWIASQTGMTTTAGLGLINVTSRPLGLIDVQSRRSLGMINIQNRQRRW